MTDQPNPALRITSDENFNHWFAYGGRTIYFHCVLKKKHEDGMSTVCPTVVSSDLDVIHYSTPKRLGKLGVIGHIHVSPSSTRTPRSRLDKVFEFFTAADGVLRVPQWCGLKYAVDQYLEDPRIKYHPSRVQQFIQEHGLEELDSME